MSMPIWAGGFPFTSSPTPYHPGSKPNGMRNMQKIEATVIENLLLGACPERREELQALWHQYRPTFALSQDLVGTTFKAAGNRVIWSHKTVAHDWIIAFAGWQVFRAYGAPILVAAMTGELTAGLFQSDEGLSAAEAGFDEMTYSARAAREVDRFEDIPWPPSVPMLTDNRESLPSEAQVSFDLAALSLAASFLHELRHVQFWTDKNAPGDVQQEERACDAFSRTFLLDRVADYATETEQDAVAVANKRIMGLATAAYIIDEATPRSGSAGLAESHPPSADRFRELVLKGEAPQTADCWTYTASLLLASLRRANRMPRRLQFSSPRHLCDQLVALL